MDWYKAMDNLADRRAESSSGRADMVADFLAGPPPNWDGSTDRETTGTGTLLSIGGKTVAIILGAWLLAYASGALSWLGEYSFSYADRVRSETRLGLSNMVLVKGQRAYIKYDVHSMDGYDGNIFFDIRPWPFIKSSPAMIRRSGDQQGVLEIIVPSTGFYQFYHGVGPMAYQQPLRYQANWGADWGEVAGAQVPDND